MNVTALAAALDARSVALLGATPQPDKLAHRVWLGLIGGSLKHVWAVNPKYRAIGEHPCYPDLETIDQRIDLAVVALPAHRVAQAIEMVGRKKIRTALILFDATWQAGDRAWLEHIARTARDAGVRLIGPESFGILVPGTGLFAGLLPQRPSAGSVTLIAQSSAIAAAALESLSEADVGFSAVVSSGLEIDIDCAELLEYYAHDAKTRTIALHVEAIRNPRRFYAALREAAKHKRVVVLKARDDEHYTAERLTSFKYHTGTGRDDAFEALIESAGAMRVTNYDEFVGVTLALSRRAHPRNTRLAVVSNSSALAGLAAFDAAAGGVELTSFTAQTALQLRQRFPQAQLPVNPIDLGASATPDDLADAVAAVAADPRIDAVLAIAAPGAFGEPEAMAQTLAKLSGKLEKPLFFSWVSEARSRDVLAALAPVKGHKLVAVSNPVRALKVFSVIARYAQRMAARVGAPELMIEPIKPETLDAVREIVKKALAAKRHLLTSEECERVIALLGASMPPSASAKRREDVPGAYETLGGRIVLKVKAGAIAHKTDVDGVRLDLRTSEETLLAFDEVFDAVGRLSPLTPFEGVTLQRFVPHKPSHAIRLALLPDSVFGPLVEIGGAGAKTPPLVAPASLGVRRATQMWREVAKTLEIPRKNEAADEAAFVRLLLTLARVACAIPALYRISLNPVVASDAGALVLDATMHLADRALVRDAEHAKELCIAPAPEEKETWDTKSGATFTLRSLDENDFWRLKRFVDDLGDEGRRLRFHSRAPVTDSAVAQLTQLNYDREAAWALVDDKGAIAGVARFSETDEKEVEFAIAIAPTARRLGLATRLMAHLEADARARGYVRISGSVLRGNAAMEALMARLGFTAGEERDARRWSKSLKKALA